jgi:hypothetical protein
MSTEADLDLIHLRKQLGEHFNLEETQTLCFDLHIVYENLPGDNTLASKTRELVKYCYRNGMLDELIEYCQKERPKVTWAKQADGRVASSLPEEWDDPLQQLYALVRALNRNRHQAFSGDRTREGDDIAYQMREAAPLLFGKFDVGAWLDGNSPGKRLAAIKYLDWLQDIDFLGNLLGKLTTEKPFMQLHCLVAIDHMLDQLDNKTESLVKARLLAYNIIRSDDSLEFWKKRILTRLG